MTTIHPYGSALTGEVPDREIPESHIDFRVDTQGNLLMLIFPDGEEEISKELNAADADEIFHDQAVLEILEHTTVSDTVRKECAEEMRQAEQRGWHVRS